MTQSGDAHPPLCTTLDASRQVEAVVRFILAHQSIPRLSLISDSWGSMPAGRFAGAHPALVDRWVLFGPIARRRPARGAKAPVSPAWRLITADDQWKRFIEDVPPDEPPVLLQRHFESWAEAYLDTDPQSRERLPRSVKTPAGPFHDILRAWHGDLGYDLPSCRRRWR